LAGLAGNKFLTKNLF